MTVFVQWSLASPQDYRGEGVGQRRFVVGVGGGGGSVGDGGAGGGGAGGGGSCGDSVTKELLKICEISTCMDVV